MARYFILGNTGSGKSTLAKRLAQEHSLMHIDLDEYAWTKTIGERRDLEEALCALRGKLGGRPAVVEGMYSDLVERLLSADDQLVWLDLPIEVCVQHCQARPFEPHKWESAAAQDAFLPRLLEFLRTYPEREDELGRAAHERVFDAFIGKKVHIVEPAVLKQVFP